MNQATNNAIINWQSFSIASGETTKFVVPTSASATLNRVVGGNPSAIFGTLQSNGQVFLINPSGILVGAGGRIDTAGFLGSTLDVSNDEFMAGGNMHFFGDSTAKITNKGQIDAEGGSVYLIADKVNNKGTITASQGDVGLAAGSSILFQPVGDQHLFIQPTPSDSKRALAVNNSGTIKAASAELRSAGGNAYALAINNTGSIVATGYKKINGQVYLT
ncbi:MAG TPA: filamentous hemagglutinin N-terminal domain-containing protein, partial [Candidatus Methylacidiphilales bacterium]